MIDLKSINNEVTDVLARGLHYVENIEKINSLKTAAEVNAACEGGVERYMTDPVYSAKIKMLVAHIMQRIVPLIETGETK